MDFNLSEEQEMLRAGADRFVRSHYTLEQRRQQIASGVPCKREHWAQFAELGWLMLNVPESAGGLGASLIETSVLMQSFGRGPVLEPYINTAVLAARVLERATENQIARQLLTDIANGERRFALAHGEPNGADNPRAVKTAASPHRDKYRLSGRKFMALDAPSADTLIVSGTVEGESAYALFLVEHDVAGVSLSTYPLIDGTHAADIEFNDVPAQLLLGADVAASVLDEAIDRATVAWLAHGVGSMDACLEVCREYVNTRQQFGQPLGKFQALQHLLADMFVSVQESHSILFQALAQIDNADIAVRQRAVSAAKIVIGEALQFVLGQGIQLHGGYGITDEYAVSHFYKHGLVLEKLLGDSAVHVQRFIAAGKAASGKALVG